MCNIYSPDVDTYLPYLFVDMLADLLSSDPDAPFPELETLSFELLQVKEPMLQGCADACTKLASALEHMTRYPRFKRLNVHMKMPGSNTRGREDSPSVQEIAALETLFRSCLARVEVVGVQLEILVACV